VRSAVARCGTQAGGSTVRSAVAADSQDALQIAGCVAFNSPVGGEMLAAAR